MSLEKNTRSRVGGDIAVLPIEISDPNADCKHDRNAQWDCLRDVRSDTRHSAVLGGLQFHSASVTLVSAV